MKNFVNEPFVDFTKEENKQHMKDAFALVDSLKGKTYPLIIDGEKIFTEEKITSINPSKKNDIIGYASSAGLELAEKAITSSVKAFETWRFTPLSERIQYFQEFIKVLTEHRFEMVAWIVEEAGRNFDEAYFEVAQAIDFCNSYSMGMHEFEKGIPCIQTDSEQNECNYIPMGAGVIIPPWNYPLTLMAGMTIAPLLAGNTVIIKPSSETPVVASKFVELLELCHFPKGVINFLPGSGGKIGDFLVGHPKTRFVSFTGSMEVGLHISELAAKIQKGQIWIKRVVAEMGGKNAIIVDSSADLKLAVEGIVTSAFGFQGQKCSACSRVLLMDDVYDKFMELLVERVSKIQMGPGRDNLFMGPVISKRAYDGIVSYIEAGKKEGTLVCGGTYDDREGFYIQPTVIKDITPADRIAREEVFGPLLAVIRVKSFTEAIEIANGTEYALTGSVFTTDQKQIEMAKQLFNVGNLSINRKTTGGLVYQQPFGGFNMSGTCAKTGIKDYLLNFLLTKTIATKK